MPKTIINADDFGLSPGVNCTIIYCFKEKLIDRASLIVTTDYRDEATAYARTNPTHLCGLHLDLMYGKAIKSKNGLLVDNSGYFRKGYLGLLLSTLLRPRETKKALHEEIRAQFQYLRDQGIKISHVDGHNHVHLIPMVNRIVREVVQEYDVNTIRSINESFLQTLFVTKDIACLGPKRIVRHLFIRFLALFTPGSDTHYFYSLVFSCELTAKRMIAEAMASNRHHTTEVMVHPGNPALDAKATIRDKRTRKFLLSSNRKKEFEALKSFQKL